ncbi:hypothetical protein Tco_0883665 [Tanacetum coccineum]
MIRFCNKMDATTPKYFKSGYEEIMKEVSSHLKKGPTLLEALDQINELKLSQAIPNRMERGFLSQKRSEVGRGVKEKQGLMADKSIEMVKYGVVPSATVAYGNTQKDLNDDLVEMEVQSLSVDLTNAVKTGRGSYPPLPTQGTNPTRNTPGKSSYANVIVDASY